MVIGMIHIDISQEEVFLIIFCITILIYIIGSHFESKKKPHQHDFRT